MGSQNKKLELEQPLISPESMGYSLQNHNSNNNNDNTIVGGGPRILDRDGTFAQSRGRWSVTNTTTTKTTSSRSQPRQRRGGGPVATSSSIATSNIGASNGEMHHGVTPTPSIYTSEGSLKQSMCCCTSSDHLPLNPRRCWDDWFHTLSYMPTCILMLGVFAAYFITIVIFAGLYLTVNKVGVYYDHSDTTHGGETTELMTEGLSLGSGTSGVDEPSFCGMDINNHMEALYFSLSTMATIGYGTSDYYFGECWTPFILVLLQVFSAIVFSSLAIGLLFQRMSRGQKRGRTIVFSDVAVIRKVRGRWYFMFRLAELRKRHIIGAKVRIFCVRHERCPVAMADGGNRDPETGNAIVELETAYFVSHPLPLVNGSQSANTTNNNHSGLTSANSSDVSESSYEQSILMGLPHVLVHSMDALSPMIPPRPVWYDEGGVPHGPSVAHSTTLSEARADGTLGESQTGNDDDKPSSLLMEERQSTPSSLLQMTGSENNTNTNQPSQEEITHFLQDRQAEIICFLEGTCENTGMALQARHSYRMEDIAFHQTFAPCVFPAASVTATSHQMGGKRTWRHPFARNKARVEQEPTISHEGGSKPNSALEIDFTQFHDLLPAPYDSMSCPYIPSSSLRR